MNKNNLNNKLIKVPSVGESITDVLIFWEKKNGDIVSKGDILFSVESEKVNIDVNANYSGEVIVYSQEKISEQWKDSLDIDSSSSDISAKVGDIVGEIIVDKQLKVGVKNKDISNNFSLNNVSINNSIGSTNILKNKYSPSVNVYLENTKEYPHDITSNFKSNNTNDSGIVSYSDLMRGINKSSIISKKNNKPEVSSKVLSSNTMNSNNISSCLNLSHASILVDVSKVLPLFNLEYDIYFSSFLVKLSHILLINNIALDANQIDIDNFDFNKIVYSGYLKSISRFIDLTISNINDLDFKMISNKISNSLSYILKEVVSQETDISLFNHTKEIVSFYFSDINLSDFNSISIKRNKTVLCDITFSSTDKILYNSDKNTLKVDIKYNPSIYDNTIYSFLSTLKNYIENPDFLMNFLLKG